MDGDEEDGNDEGDLELCDDSGRVVLMSTSVIYPMDHKVAGHIVDDVSESGVCSCDMLMRVCPARKCID